MDISTTGCQALAAGRPDGGRRDGPSASLPPPGPGSEAEVMWLRRVLGRAVVGPQAEHIGHVHDLVVRPLADRSGSVVNGLIVDVGGYRAYVRAGAVRHWRVRTITVGDMLAADRAVDGDTETGSVGLGRSVLGQPVLTTAAETRARRIADVGLCRTSAGWQVWVVDTRPRWQRLCGRSRRLTEWSVLLERRRFHAPAATASRWRAAGAASRRADGRAVAATRCARAGRRNQRCLRTAARCRS